METYQRELIELMVRCDVLSFGEFVAKSGRLTPYFINAGRYRTGAQISRLSRFYAQAIRTRFAGTYDVLFGPAYKGIPLVVATAMAMHEEEGREVAFCFNRKEVKDHGEGGSLVGHTLKDGDRVLIVEDVTTAGSSIHEVVPLLRAQARIELAGLVVAVDRMERGRSGRPALQELADMYGMQTHALVTIDDIVQHLRGHSIDGHMVLTESLCARIADYRAQYGTS